MSSLEDEIRDALRSEAGRLREVRPLYLESAQYLEPPLHVGPVLLSEPALHREPAPGHGASPRRARPRWTWLAPVTAAALVIVIAIALVIVRMEQSAPVAPVIPAPPVPTAIPRYYAVLEDANNDGNEARLVVGDSVTGKTLATFNAPAGASFEGTTISGAADDRTWVVAQTLGQRKPPYPPWDTDGPTQWYLLRLSPGSARPVTMTRLAIQASASDLPITETILSPDGRYIAAASGDAGTERVDLLVYSVATGQLVHAWTMVNASAFSYTAPGDLSWANGDQTVAFTVSEHSYAQVRTVTVAAPGTGLLTDSRVVWSQYNPAPPHGVLKPGWPQACDPTILTADGHFVTCHAPYPVGTAPTATVWLAYPISAPTKPRVIARLPVPAEQPTNSTEQPGSWLVDVTPSEVIGYQFLSRHGYLGPATIRWFVASGGTIRQRGSGVLPMPFVTW